MTTNRCEIKNSWYYKIVDMFSLPKHGKSSQFSQQSIRLNNWFSATNYQKWPWLSYALTICNS